MLIFPAIDLKDGKVVRLLKGSFDTVHQVAEDPVHTADLFLQAGAKYIHMVDLDGARSSSRKNSDIVRAVAQTGIKIELGGGLRSMADLAEIFQFGVWRAVLGSAAVSDPEFVKEAITTYGPDRISVGIDALNGKVRIAGWETDSGLDYLEFAVQMDKIGVKSIIFTDIDTDGMLSGPSFEKLKALQQHTSCRITASGGISCNEDIRKLNRLGVDSAIIGKAWYAGKIDLTQAITDAGNQE